MSKFDLLHYRGSNKHALDVLSSYSFGGKMIHSLRKIEEWYKHWEGQVYVSFSGGEDSLVLLHLVRSLYPEVPAVFADTGLEFPEIKEFIKTIDNVEWLKPKKSFKQVIEDYGYPVISKEQSCYIEQYRNTKSEKLRHDRFYGKDNYRDKSVGKISEKWKYMIDAPFKISNRCCNILKKAPFKVYENETGRKPFIGSMAVESAIRQLNYHQHGCNAFQLKRPLSTPIIFWNEEDIWKYIRMNNLAYCKIYDMGYIRTGCIFCMFGMHHDKESRLDTLKNTHPRLYEYCMDKLEIRKVLEWYPVKKETICSI